MDGCVRSLQKRFKLLQFVLDATFMMVTLAAVIIAAVGLQQSVEFKNAGQDQFYTLTTFFDVRCVRLTSEHLLSRTNTLRVPFALSWPPLPTSFSLSRSLYAPALLWYACLAGKDLFRGQ